MIIYYIILTIINIIWHCIYLTYMEISEKNPTNQGTFHWLGRDFPELPHVVAAAAAAVTQDGQAGHQVRKHMQYMKYIYIYIYICGRRQHQDLPF